MNLSEGYPQLQVSENPTVQSNPFLLSVRGQWSAGDTPIYVYTWCRDIRPHNTYQEGRRDIYSYRGREFREIRL